ncbi:DinB family protein [Edaphobacillus lindanitolerans]|uniref:Uncharacterized damage-inducible protein DinB (Forms a four-helix bundle) n=1 Tax=Edaphobacillus lindanitolerans TaxID=550447 RepID=A0A1U7PPB2_9BACI|nr:DinB family protein [Edaphobacillus lindanitolerans]SIT79639.1 Uncharacterized damage-inducible protein DinB (forms a four-helix bundle) [Edaphobacillus lindanitolerans]
MNINEEARRELLQAVSGLSDEELNRKPENGGWSIKQILEHLSLMEGTVAKTIKLQAKNGETVKTEERPIEASVNRDVKVDAPEFVIPSEDFATKNELEQRLAASRSILQRAVESTDERSLETKAFPHPVFGMMKLKQWIPFVGFHEKRHIEQIREVIKGM